MTTYSTELAMLSTIRAFLDVVTPELRAVVVNAHEKAEVFYIRVYYDGNVSEDIIEDWNCAITEATASSSFTTDESIERVDFPHQIPVNGRLAYLRREPYTSLNRSLLSVGFNVKRELINFEKPIGIYISPKDLKYCSTTWGIVHSNEYGPHTIPARPLSFETDLYLEAYARLALQRSLLGRVTPELRVVITEALKGSNHVFIRFFYDRPVSREILGEWECALSEVMADFGQGYTFDVAIQQIPHPKTMPVKGSYVYSRKEAKDPCKNNL